MDEYAPSTVKSFIEFLYTGDYSTPTENEDKVMQRLCDDQSTRMTPMMRTRA
jgi:hypothetical protein